MKRPILIHPIVLASIAVLAMNDHVWKRAAPGFVTGKLSDVAGLIFFPAMLAAGWGLTSQRSAAAGNAVRVLVRAGLATALVFALVKTWGPANLAYRWGLGALQWPLFAMKLVIAGQPVRSIAPVGLEMDVTDLIALPFALTALLVRELGARLRLRPRTP